MSKLYIFQVPALKTDDGKVTSDSTRIVHHLESRVPVDQHPPLVPCTTDTRMYQKHVYFTALIDQVNMRNAVFVFSSTFIVRQ